MSVESIVGRRKFLKGAAIFAGVAAFLGIARPGIAKPKKPLRHPEQSAQGYRLTEHVKKYYETARL